MGIRSLASSCSKCGGTEALKHGVCRPCRLEYNRQYYLANKAKIDAQNKAWAAANREKSRAIKRRWAEANPDAMRNAIADWRKRNSARDAANKQRWNRDNAARKRILTNNRRHKLRGKLSANIVDLLMERQNALCACCGADLVYSGFHIDHIRPISKGGLNVDSNVQLLTPTCNMRKNAKWPIA